MKGRRILVTGASGAIGRAVALALGRADAFVVGAYRSSEKAAAALRLSLARRGRVVRADLSTEAGRAVVVEACEDGLDGAVLCAGIARHGPFVGVEDRSERADLSAQIHTNLESPLQLVQALAAADVLRGGASLVFVSSNLARLGVAGTVGYAASKAGLEGAVRALAAELGPLGVRVNAVAPGLLLSPMGKRRSSEALALVARTTPLRRLGEPEDVVGPILFLLGADAAFVTGQVLDVDGGAAVAGV